MSQSRLLLMSLIRSKLKSSCSCMSLQGPAGATQRGLPGKSHHHFWFTGKCLNHFGLFGAFAAGLDLTLTCVDQVCIARVVSYQSIADLCDGAYPISGVAPHMYGTLHPPLSLQSMTGSEANLLPLAATVTVTSDCMPAHQCTYGMPCSCATAAMSGNVHATPRNFKRAGRMHMHTANTNHVCACTCAHTSICFLAHHAPLLHT